MQGQGEGGKRHVMRGVRKRMYEMGECPPGMDNDERRVPTDFNYGICAGETLNFPVGTCPTPPPPPSVPLYVLTLPPPAHPFFPNPLRFGPAFRSARPCNFNFAPSL